MALVLVLAAPVPGLAVGRVEAAPASAQAQPAAAPGDLERRLKDLEALVAGLQAEIDRLRAGAPAAPPPAATVIADLQKKVEALTREIERLRVGEAASPQAGESVQGFGPAASKVYRVGKGVSIGGYGETLYENFDRRADDGSPPGRTDRADQLRGVFYFGYKFNDRVLFNSEVEFEHAGAGEDAPGEAALEFAYVDFKAARSFGVRGGLLLVPLGFLNELHEPPIFLGARRPEVERFIIPSTWRENGAGVYGSAGPVSYKVYLVTGLDASGFSADEGIRGGRQEGAEAAAQNLAVTARVDWTPRPGLLLGAGGYAGGAGQGTPGLARARYSLWEAHGEWNWKGLHVRGLYARGVLADAEAVGAAIDSAAGDPPGTTILGSRQAGWYGEIAWNVLTAARRTEQQLVPFVRYERLDTQESVAPGFVADPVNDRTVRTWGIAYRPIPQVAIKADVQNFTNGRGTALDQFNLALGYLF